MDLPKNESSFHFEVVGDVTGKTYDGEFTTICVPNVSQRRMIEIEKSRFTADLQNPTDHLTGLAVCISNLRVRILEAPSWWKDMQGNNCLDENVIVALYDKVMEQEDEWRMKVRGTAESKEDDELGKEEAERK